MSPSCLPVYITNLTCNLASSTTCTTFNQLCDVGEATFYNYYSSENVNVATLDACHAACGSFGCTAYDYDGVTQNCALYIGANAVNSQGTQLGNAVAYSVGGC